MGVDLKIHTFLIEFADATELLFPLDGRISGNLSSPKPEEISVLETVNSPLPVRSFLHLRLKAPMLEILFLLVRGRLDDAWIQMRGLPQ